MTTCWRAGLRHVSRALLISVLATTLLAPLGPLQAASADLEPFFGAYVGVAMVEDLRTGEIQQRDMDIVVEPYHEDGLSIQWVNVTLVDGRRDLPGVQRRVQTVLFEPAEDRELYVEVQENNPFRERASTLPMRGDPVRWATVDGPRFHVYSFVVLEDGRYELQIYDRVLTDKGIDIRFQRIVDGELLRQVEGTTVRTGEAAAED